MQRAHESNGSGIANSAKCTCQEGNLTSCMMAPVRRKKEKMALQVLITLAPIILPGQQRLPVCANVFSIHTLVTWRTPRFLLEMSPVVHTTRAHILSHILPKKRDLKGHQGDYLSVLMSDNPKEHIRDQSQPLLDPSSLLGFFLALPLPCDHSLYLKMSLKWL